MFFPTNLGKELGPLLRPLGPSSDLHLHDKMKAQVLQPAVTSQSSTKKWWNVYVYIYIDLNNIYIYLFI